MAFRFLCLIFLASTCWSCEEVSQNPFGDPPPAAAAPATPAANVEDPFPGPPDAPKTETAPSQTAPTVRSVTVEFPEETAARVRLDGLLAKRGQFVYSNTPLSDVAADIQQRFKIPVIFDHGSLNDAGIGLDAGVTVECPDITLRAALELILEEHDLMYGVRHEVLMIMSRESNESSLSTRLYDVSDILPAHGGNVVYRSSSRAQSLIRLITNTIDPDSWTDAGGAGDIEYLDHLNTLAISQTESTLARIDNLFRILKSIRDQKGPSNQPQTEKVSGEMILRVYAVQGNAASAGGKAALPDAKPGVKTSQRAAGAMIRAVQFGGSGLQGGGESSAKPSGGGFHSLSGGAVTVRRTPVDWDELVRFITTSIESGSWGDSKGMVTVVGDFLIVRNSESVQRQVEALLRDLELLRNEPCNQESGFGSESGGGFFAVPPEALAVPAG